MTFQERVLYHQVHPVKLVTDVGAAAASLWLLAEHKLLTALLVMFVPPVLVSATVISTGRLESIKNSVVGRYLSEHMTPAATALRFVGMLIMSVGAWRRQLAWLVAGLTVVVYAWTRGLIAARSQAK